MDLEVPIAPGGGIPFEGIRNGGFTDDRTNQEGLVCLDLNRYRFWTEIRGFHVAYIFYRCKNTEKGWMETYHFRGFSTEYAKMVGDSATV